MKILFIKNWIHFKNLNSLQNYKNIQFTVINSINDIDKNKCKEFDVIYSPSEPINVNDYKECKFIFGPHFSIFPNQNQIHLIEGSNSIYVQPSDWAVNSWKIYNCCKNLKMKSLPFGVDTNKFNELENVEKKNIFLYTKTRENIDIKIMIDFLKKYNINYKIFNYDQKYSEDEYIEYLKTSKYGVWVGRHESQGFALEEALSCNVPLFVWDVVSMNQEVGQNYSNISATAIPYWDERCGEYFYHPNELEKKFNLFLSKLKTYKPREFILENLSMEACEKKLINIIKDFK